ncbi:MAG: hypothetical protein HDQ92_02960 [Desulfovibrio sp.]|nr:hypothetical protein [Desulfovibrio sp.]
MTDMTAEAHLREIEKRLESNSTLNGLQEKSGSVFFSERETLRPGLVYFLGINPGGCPNHKDPREVILKNIVPPNGENAYYEAWEPSEPGAHPFQRNVKKFLGSLKDIGVRPETERLLREKQAKDSGKSPLEEEECFVRSICSSNLCFIRSSAVTTLRPGLRKAIAADVHDYILNTVVKPSIVLINGLGAYDIFTDMLGLKGGRGEDLDTGMKCKVWLHSLDGDKLVVGLPHLSPRRPHHRAVDNGHWQQHGYRVLLEKCRCVLENRPDGGCTWPRLQSAC